MAVSAAPYLHPKLTAIDAKIDSAGAPPAAKKPSVVVRFVVSGREDD
jgi:hypothetical protein